ncbi:MAG TPA: hypothetical protein GX521_01010 [Firmicutes bacterium]|nr:hypothetical protein [Bacillota bacterium]
MENRELNLKLIGKIKNLIAKQHLEKNPDGKISIASLVGAAWYITPKVSFMMSASTAGSLLGKNSAEC